MIILLFYDFMSSIRKIIPLILLTGTVTYMTGFNIIKNKVAISIIQCTLELYRKVKIIFCHTYFCKRNPMMRLYHILPYHVMLLLTKHASFGKY